MTGSVFFKYKLTIMSYHFIQSGMPFYIDNTTCINFNLSYIVWRKYCNCKKIYVTSNFMKCDILRVWNLVVMSTGMCYSSMLLMGLRKTMKTSVVIVGTSVMIRAGILRIAPHRSECCGVRSSQDEIPEL